MHYYDNGTVHKHALMVYLRGPNSHTATTEPHAILYRGWVCNNIATTHMTVLLNDDFNYITLFIGNHNV